MKYDIDTHSIEIEKALKIVQKIFDEYQNMCFTERSSEFFCLELNGEAGELANLEKKSWKGKTIQKEFFSDEAADVLIALMNYSNAKGVDLGQAVKEKLLTIEKKRSMLLENGELY
jgi:NTP pyrophosphatase (non-canonical NTP hydrolase)